MPATERVVLFEEPGGVYRIEVDLPLSSKVNPEELRNELGIPPYVDLEYLSIRTALVMLKAAKDAHRLHEEFPGIIEKRISKDPLNILIFGGGAFKIHCPSCNKGGIFERVLHDIDVIVPYQQGAAVKNLLLVLGDLYGTLYLHFMSTSDKIFSGMRRGKRWRLRSIKEVNNDGYPRVEVRDILTDEIDMRHTVSVVDEFKEDPQKLLYTIGLEKMIITKCQFIMDMEKNVLPELEAQGLGYRRLQYENYDPNKIIIGMEMKDIKDICAVFLDHPLDNGPEAIDVGNIKRILSDKKLLKTVRLNLENIVINPDILASFGAPTSQISTIVTRIEELLGQLPQSDKKWSKPWWNLDVHTPEIFKGN